VKTDTPLQFEGNCAPSPFKAARTILTASGQVKIACGSVTSLISRCFLARRRIGRSVLPRRISARPGGAQNPSPAFWRGGAAQERIWPRCVEIERAVPCVGYRPRG
jgi:hypothetical protein